MTNTRIFVAIFTLTLFGCGSDGPFAPTTIPVEIPEPESQETTEPESPETEPEPPDPDPPEMPEPEPPETPEPEPEPPETPDPDPDPDPDPSPPEIPDPDPDPDPEPKPSPEPPEVVVDYIIACACDDVRVGDVIVLRVESEIAGAGQKTYHWAATPGSDPIPGDSPTPKWNPGGSGQVEITVWVTGDIGTVVVSRIIEVTAKPAPPAPKPPPPPPPEPDPPEEPDPEPPVQTKPWGAWSGNHDQTIAGVSAGKDSRDEADRAALADCRSRGGTGCTSAGASGGQFQNQCFAIAHGKVTLENPRRPPHCGGRGQATCPVSPYYQTYVSLDEPTQRAAEAKTMYDCPRGGGALGSGTECKMLASICQP